MIALVWAILAVLTWAGFLLLLRGAVRDWPVGQIGVYSRLVTVALLGGWVVCRGAGWSRLRPRGRGGWLLVMGLVSVGINLGWFAGLQYTTATNTALLFRLDLLFVVLIGLVMNFERINRIGMAVAPVMFLGLALVMEAHQLRWTDHIRGDLMIVGAAFGFAVNAFVIRHILERLDEEAVATYNHALSGIGFALVMLMQGVSLPQDVIASPRLWWWVPILGVAGAVSLPIYYAALRRLAVWKLRVLMLLAPLLVAWVDWLVWRERLEGLQWLGAALLLGGALILILAEARAARRTAPDNPAAESGQNRDHAISPSAYERMETTATSSHR